MIPAFVGQDLGTKYDWNYSTTEQTFLDNGKRVFNSGRAVGGSSILNGMVWTRGAEFDYDAWEALGNPGWGWKDLLPYFMMVSLAILTPAWWDQKLTELPERNIHASGTQRHQRCSSVGCPGAWTRWPCPSSVPELPLRAVR